MSGLEPLAALGLACNIMQMITFTGESISICRRIYNDGQPDPSLDDYAQRLLGTSESLRDIISRSSGNLTSDDQALRSTAEKCIDVAGHLTKEIQSLSVPRSQTGFRVTLRQGVKAIFHKSRLERLENDLRNIQSAMHTQLLVRTLNRLDISAIQQQGTVAESRRLLDDTLRQYSAKHDNFARENLETRDQLLKAITAATARMEELTRIELSKNTQLIQGQMGTIATHTQHHAAKFQEWTTNSAEEAAYERILQSLKFDSMEERKNQICETYPKTFDWIFEPRHRKTTSSEDSGSEASNDWETVTSINSDDECDEDFCYGFDATDWDSFVDWLRSNDLVYWISGKPGSGKSTLMKFISSNPQTQTGLNEWRPETQILSHYFWKAGSQLQHSLKGFMCSLVYQIFCHDRAAALAYLQQNPDQSHHLSSTSDWDMIELQRFLLDYIRQLTTTICIFVDGLDELMPQSDTHDLLSLFNNLSRLGTKLCVSSRRERVIQNYMELHPNVEINKLTKPDIFEYATRILSRAISRTDQEFGVGLLARSIVQKSDGVFLWAVLVSKSLVRGVENGDSNDELLQRLDSMPSDLMALYKDMWLRLNEDHKIYKTTSCWYFNIILVWMDESTRRAIPYLRDGLVSVFEVMAATDVAFSEQFSERLDELSTNELERRCRQTANSVVIRSAGLLQVVQREPESIFSYDPDPYESAVVYSRMTVGFVHRTARDYLVETEDGRSIWQTNSISTEDVYSRLVHASLLRRQIWKNTPMLHNDMSPHGSLESFLKSIRWTRTKAGKAHQARLLSVIEMAWLSGDLYSISVNQAKPNERRILFIAHKAMFGFDDHILNQLHDMKPSSEAMHSILLECCKLSLPDSYTMDWEDFVDRDRVIRQLLNRGVNPNPIQIQLLNKPLAVDAATSPWLSYLASTIEYLTTFRGAEEPLPGRVASEEILETLTSFIKAGGSLCTRNLRLFLWRKKGSYYSHVDILRCFNISYQPGHGLALSVNVPWLIGAILAHLRSDINIARLDCGKQLPSAKVLLIASAEDEIVTTLYIHRFYALESRENGKPIINAISQWLLDSISLDLSTKKNAKAEMLKTFDSILPRLISEAKPMSIEKAEKFLRKRGYLCASGSLPPRDLYRY
ncbi:hypothetical protein FDECE_2265 [Fusarium decemcellulare]|nr:hypothetical protein FDECE_2265 [Fusarium decemcellulare]